MRFHFRTFCTALMLLAALPVAGVTLGQIQTFDSPPSGWVVGVGPVIGTPTDVPIEPTGGPGGDDDAYMSIVSTGGSGPGSRLSAQNFGIWSGNYTAAGVSGIRMDVNNFGPETVFLRLLFVDFAGMNPVNAAFTDAIEIQPGSGWENVTFNVTPAALTALLGTASDALANTDEFRLFHNPDPFFAPNQNPAVTATLGVDNMNAIPEPGSAALVIGGLLLLPLALRRVAADR